MRCFVGRAEQPVTDLLLADDSQDETSEDRAAETADAHRTDEAEEPPASKEEREGTRTCRAAQPSHAVEAVSAEATDEGAGSAHAFTKTSTLHDDRLRKEAPPLRNRSSQLHPFHPERTNTT